MTPQTTLDIDRVRHAAWRWEVLSPWTPWLRECANLPWNDLSTLRSAQRLKSNPRREVWKLSVPEPAIVAKIYRRRGAWSRIGGALLGASASGEFLAACRAARLDLPAIRPVAFGRSDETHVFLSEWIDRALTLDDAWRAADTASRRTLASAVGRLLARLHSGQFGPSDLHPQNILVQQEAGVPKLTLIDLHRVHCGRISNRRAQRAFVDLNQWFGRHATRSEGLRCLAAYLQDRRTLRHWAVAIQNRSIRQAERLARRRDRRIYGDGRHVAAIDRPDGWSGWVVLRPRLVPTNDAPLDLPGWHDVLDQVGLPEVTVSLHTVLLAGSHAKLTVERGAVTEMKSRWESLHRATNRHRIGCQPLALLIERAGAQAVLIRQSDPPARDFGGHSSP